jgi:cellobiose-specific phosphotransferase system component IIA
MMTAPDVGKLRSLSSESRQAVTSAFEALDQWRDEVFSANERCLTKVLDQMAAAHRGVGWPDHVTSAAREHLIKASKVQTQMIDQVMDAWEQRLKSQDTAGSLPEGLTFQMPAFSDPVTEMMRFGEMTLVPFKLWIQAAEAWQRSLAAAMPGSEKLRSPPSSKKAA